MAKKSKKSTKHLKTSTSHAPSFSSFEVPQRSVLQEGKDALTLMKKAYPEIYGLRNKYDPKFAELEARTGEARANAELGAVNRMGGKIRDALRGANPGLAKADDAMQQQLDEMGPSDIEKELTQQTLAELKLGGALSADEIRNNQQGSRAAWSARGLSGSNSAMVDEVMNRTTYSNQRKSQRQASASAVDAQNQNRQAGDRAFTINTFNTQGAYYDPYQRIYGAGGSAVTGQVSGPNAFQPFLQSANAIGEGNQQATIAGMQLQSSREMALMEMNAQRENALMQRNSNESIARGNNRAGITGAAIGGVGMGLGILARMII